MRNYARCIEGERLGQVRFFEGNNFHPIDPASWAVWRPIGSEPRMHRIGEAPWIYALRQLAIAGSREASGLLAVILSRDVQDPTWQVAADRAIALTGVLP